MFTLPHPAIYWNNIMKSTGRKATAIELEEAAKAAEWMCSKLPTKKFRWHPSSDVSGKFYMPENIDDIGFILRRMEKGGPLGSAATTRESIINKYTPDLVSYGGASSIGGGRSPASAALLHELGHSMRNGPIFPQAAILADRPAGSLGYSSWLSKVLPASVLGQSLIKYLERGPLLIEEARASINAMMALSATNASKATRSNVRNSLLGSFGTYLNPF